VHKNVGKAEEPEDQSLQLQTELEPERDHRGRRLCHRKGSRDALEAVEADDRISDLATLAEFFPSNSSMHKLTVVII